MLARLPASVLSVAALKNRGKITGVVRPFVQPHHYSKPLGIQDAMNDFSSDGGPAPTKAVYIAVCVIAPMSTCRGYEKARLPRRTMVRGRPHARRYR